MNKQRQQFIEIAMERLYGGNWRIGDTENRNVTLHCQATERRITVPESILRRGNALDVIRCIKEHGRMEFPNQAYYRDTSGYRGVGRTRSAELTGYLLSVFGKEYEDAGKPKDEGQ